MAFDHSKYYRDKYKNDPEYRKNRITWSSNWTAKNRKRINDKNRKHYANRTSQQIKKRRQRLKKMRASGKWSR